MQAVFHWVDVLGAFVFALSGAIMAVRRKYDVFGIFAIALVTAIGGGVVRDLCIGATPPAGLVNFEYLTAVVIAVISVRYFQNFIFSFEKPSLFFDAIGLGFYAWVGTVKTFHYTQNAEISIILGCATAVGGGVLRDVLCNRTPIIFKGEELYATAAIIGALIEVLGATGWIPEAYSSWLSMLTCILIRLLALKYGIRLPVIKMRRR